MRFSFLFSSVKLYFFFLSFFLPSLCLSFFLSLFFFFLSFFLSLVLLFFFFLLSFHLFVLSSTKQKQKYSSNGIMLVDAEDVPSPDASSTAWTSRSPSVVKEEKKRRKPFWFEGTYRVDEDGNEVERIRDGRWEEDFGTGGGRGRGRGDGEAGVAHRGPRGPSGGGREGWE